MSTFFHAEFQTHAKSIHVLVKCVATQFEQDVVNTRLTVLCMHGGVAVLTISNEVTIKQKSKPTYCPHVPCQLFIPLFSISEINPYWTCQNNYFFNKSTREKYAQRHWRILNKFQAWQEARHELHMGFGIKTIFMFGLTLVCICPKELRRLGVHSFAFPRCPPRWRWWRFADHWTHGLTLGRLLPVRRMCNRLLLLTMAREWWPHHNKLLLPYIPK